MLSSLSLADRSSLNESQHSSVTSSASSLPTTTTRSSSVAAPRPSSSQTQLKNAATTTPSFGSSRQKHDQRDLVGGDKENVSPPHPNKSTETSHTGDGSLVVFPEKQLVNTDAPSPSTQELLRQQELQLRVLQEQVSANACLFLMSVLWLIAVFRWTVCFVRKVSTLLPLLKVKVVQHPRLRPGLTPDRACSGTHPQPHPPLHNVKILVTILLLLLSPLRLGHSMTMKTVCVRVQWLTWTWACRQPPVFSHRVSLKCTSTYRVIVRHSSLSFVAIRKLCVCTMQLTLQLRRSLKVLVRVLVRLATEQREAVMSPLQPVYCSGISTSSTKTCWYIRKTFIMQFSCQDNDDNYVWAHPR